jgi:uncharacterized cupredoxin-like copper-binding protein
MPASRSLPRTAAALSLLLLPALAACGGSDAANGAETVAVEASDTACKVAKTELPAGVTTFEVTNKGTKVTEVYVYADQGGKFTKVVSEVENIGPGTSRDLSVELGGGTYEVACKPGQQGDGIRQKVTVAGKAAESDDAKYDREIEFAVTGSTVTGLDGVTAERGEKIEFKLENETDGPRELEVVDPSGAVVAEVEVPKGETGEVVVELATAGAWQIKVEGGPQELVRKVAVS